jgi:hypothetical protein
VRQEHEPLRLVGSLDDLQDPAGKRPHPLDQLARVTAIGPDAFQPGTDAAQLLEDPLGPVAILKTGAMHHDGPDQAERVDDEVALAPFDLLAGVVAVGPPFCAVFTDWLSMIAAEGVAFRPAWRRTLPRRAA